MELANILKLIFRIENVLLDFEYLALPVARSSGELGRSYICPAVEAGSTEP